MTLGWSVNPAAEFTIPSAFTIRFTLSRLPSAARVAASRLRPAARAADTLVDRVFLAYPRGSFGAQTLAGTTLATTSTAVNALIAVRPSSQRNPTHPYRDAFSFRSS
jgi:hypothetical protein